MNKNPFYLVLILLFLLSACQGGPAPTGTTSTPLIPSATPRPSATATMATPTPAPQTLVICLGQEPQSLYLYSQPSVAAWNVLEAIYDGPIDEINYTPQPVILQEIPSLANGDAKISSVNVAAGDVVVDSDGNLATLAKGINVRPSGCTGADCAVSWDGKSKLTMDQLSVTFKLLPGITWSDGQHLTATDSVYSYTQAADAATPGSKFTIDRTASYTALDDLTAEWVGIPGYLNPSALTSFWSPLPKHLWGNMSAASLLTAEESSIKPIGWGPYVIDDWVKGDHITLHKNPNYFLADKG
jgi:peptide/nickel transport system substrate-binding protein